MRYRRPGPVCRRPFACRRRSTFRRSRWQVVRPGRRCAWSRSPASPRTARPRCSAWSRSRSRSGREDSERVSPGIELCTSEVSADPAAAQRGARQRADDAVDGEPVARLEAAYRRFGFGAEDAVDFDRAEGLLEQLHLPAFAAGAEHDHVFGRRRGLGRGGGRTGGRDPGGDADGGAGGERRERARARAAWPASWPARSAARRRGDVRGSGPARDPMAAPRRGRAGQRSGCGRRRSPTGTAGRRSSGSVPGRAGAFLEAARVRPRAVCWRRSRER